VLWPAVGVLAVAAGVVAVVGSFWLGGRHALGNAVIVDVSADQVAQAMQDDHYYSDYGSDVLIIHGSVAATNRSGGQVTIEFHTNSATSMSCTLDAPSGVPTIAAHISVLVVGASAQREPSAVTYSTCRTLPPTATG